MQVIFNDKSQLMFGGVSKELEKEVVIYIDKRGKRYNHNLATIHKETDRDMLKKFKYAKDILLRLADKREERLSDKS